MEESGKWQREGRGRRVEVGEVRDEDSEKGKAPRPRIGLARVGLGAAYVY